VQIEPLECLPADGTGYLKDTTGSQMCRALDRVLAVIADPTVMHRGAQTAITPFTSFYRGKVKAKRPTEPTA
jgi:hypothetical protein